MYLLLCGFAETLLRDENQRQTPMTNTCFRYESFRCFSIFSYWLFVLKFAVNARRVCPSHVYTGRSAIAPTLRYFDGRERCRGAGAPHYHRAGLGSSAKRRLQMARRHLWPRCFDTAKETPLKNTRCNKAPHCSPFLDGDRVRFIAKFVVDVPLTVWYIMKLGCV